MLADRCKSRNARRKPQLSFNEMFGFIASGVLSRHCNANTFGEGRSPYTSIGTTFDVFIGSEHHQRLEALVIFDAKSLRIRGLYMQIP